VGHTPQWSGQVLDLGFLVCIDTGCHRGELRLIEAGLSAGGYEPANS
jgi:hypothetical protein